MQKSMADGAEETKILAEQYRTLSNELDKQIKVGCFVFISD